MILCVVGLTAIVAGAVQTITGFGAGVVLILVLARFFNMVVAPAINASICIGLTIALAWKYRKYIEPRLIILPVIPYMIASVGVISIVEYINLTVLAVLFGIFLIGLSTYFLLFADKVTIQTGWLSSVLCGFVSGIFSGLFGVGGPVISLYMLVVTDSRERYAANIQFLFTLTNIVNMSARIYRGIYTWNLIPVSILGIFGINIGKRLGIAIIDKLDTNLTKKIIYLFVGLSGIMTLVQNCFPQ